ncbi:hypothetical protein EPVG_00313 [Emiliania huxleyi virus 201]|nr:hypothetical protein ELVG_00295 [Emiliania huxleyi virus 203]AEP15783.1 hypothetical protein EQVG_00374 [Emiliania huxleyi virus 207]AEP16160.1 hypothetical protein ERVG_00285 [Emiliania huxleyi virus 208]AET98200.1 hypothetical protein EPVG_00313 [Emiliania huxleyi virus 201]
MFSYIWSSTPTNTDDDTPTKKSVSTDTSDLVATTPIPTPPPTILTPSMWCVCISEYYVDPMDCCGRGSYDRDYSAYSIVQAHTAEEAKAHFIRDDLKHRNVTVQVFPYKFGHWMDENDWFDLSRETAVF